MLGTLRITAIAALAASALLGCGGDTPEPARESNVRADRAGLAIDDWRETVTRDGVYRMRWRPVGGFVPVNEHFEAEVEVHTNDDANVPVVGATVGMAFDMPEHGHGTLTEPRGVEVGDGRYLVQGILLHMPGHWTVAANVMVDDVAATADDEIDL